MIVLLVVAQMAVATPTDSAPSAAIAPAQGRPRAVEVGDWYARRLTLHRRTAYAIIPMFGFQALAGRQIWDKGNRAPSWARNGHRVGATAIAGAFTVNVVTGVWNLIEARDATEGRGLRYLHAASMLAATAGFTYAGAVLSEQAESSLSKRRLHWQVAVSSMGITAVSGVLMKVLND
jgi:hypothetical protein